MADRAFSLKERMWIDCYVGISNGNATDAARRAGYKDPDVAAFENKGKPRIQAEIARMYAEKCMAPDEVLARMGDQARGVGAYLKTLRGSDVVVDVESLLKDGKGHLVKSAKYTDKGQPVIEFYDAQAALVHIGRHYKMWTDKIESNDPDLDAEIERRLAAMAGRGQTQAP